MKSLFKKRSFEINDIINSLIWLCNNMITKTPLKNKGFKSV